MSNEKCKLCADDGQVHQPITEAIAVLVGPTLNTRIAEFAT